MPEMPSIAKKFAYHKPGQAGLEKIQKLRAGYTALEQLILETTGGQTRERAVALTELETSAMWAIKAVVINDPESQVG